MLRPWTLTLLMAAVAAAPASAIVTFDWAHIGNPGNAPDPETGYGAVAYEYAISKHEVTNAQYAEFLNAVDPTGVNALGLYNSDMASNFGGIELQIGNLAGSRFAIKAERSQNPVTYVSFFDAMRFTNWLHNGQGTGDTETGAYAIGGGLSEARSTSAEFWIPSEDEWYKAAYHDASARRGGVYFDYATASDSIPVSDRPGDNPAALNYYNNDSLPNGFNDGFAVSGSNLFGTNPLTDAGAFTAAVSPYGTFDQNGNVMEWNEAVISSTYTRTVILNDNVSVEVIHSVSRGVRGGTWLDSSYNLLASVRDSFNPSANNFAVGFRVAAIPEPSTLLLASLLTIGLLAPRRA